MLTHSVRAASAYLFGVHYLFPDQPYWVALTFVNVALMAWLAIRSGPWQFRTYMIVAALSSLFRSSPLWHTPYDFLLALAACAFGWSLVSAGSARWFAISIGVMLAGVLAMAAPMDWPGYSPSRYHARIYAAVAMLAASVECVVDGWARRDPINWRATIAVPWFAVWFLTLVEWRTDVETHAYWVQYWHVALAGKIAACGCLCAWAVDDTSRRSRLSACAASASARDARCS